MQDSSLYKDDMDNAFGQIDLDPESARLMCIPIGETHTCLQFTGNFGEQRMPVIFQVGISAPSVRLIRSKISGCMLGYVDDHVGMAHDSVVHQDKALGQSILRTAICDSIISVKKDEPPAKEAEASDRLPCQHAHWPHTAKRQRLRQDACSVSIMRRQGEPPTQVLGTYGWLSRTLLLGTHWNEKLRNTIPSHESDRRDKERSRQEG